jgi:hypothetical protein
VAVAASQGRERQYQDASERQPALSFGGGEPLTGATQAPRHVQGASGTSTGHQAPLRTTLSPMAAVAVAMAAVAAAVVAVGGGSGGGGGTGSSGNGGGAGRRRQWQLAGWANHAPNQKKHHQLLQPNQMW